MPTVPVTEQHNKPAFDGKYSAEGNVILKDERPFLTVHEGNGVLAERVVEQVKAFCETAPQLSIHTPIIPTRTPRLFVAVPNDQITHHDTVVTVEVTRPDGKVARIHLSLSADSAGNVRATMNCPKRLDDVTVTRKATFVDWYAEVEGK